MISHKLFMYLSNMPEYHYPIIEEAIRYLKLNAKEQPSLEEVASHVNMSYHHFQKTFIEWVGISPKAFLQFLTVDHAKKLLKQGSSTLATSQKTGLSSTGRLHDSFIKITAMTPGEIKTGGKGLTILYHSQHTPFGKVLIGETLKGICFVRFIDDELAGIKLLQEEFPQAELITTNHQIPLLHNNSLNLHVKGTPFQLQVWEALLRIPEGQLASYKDMATLIGNPSASRAVGTAIGQNPIAYLIPCHRVIKSTGIFGEYRWGSNRKLAIMGWESAQKK